MSYIVRFEIKGHRPKYTDKDTLEQARDYINTIKGLYRDDCESVKIYEFMELV